MGEFLLGNLPITWLWALLTLAPLYGGGALLIREMARRRGLGWPGMVALGLAYALIEEALVTQSLFNPDYAGLRLLDYGYVPSLGIGVWWTVFVLSIHTVWSTAVPIALVESLWPRADETPWLGKLGLGVAALLFLLGCAASAAFSRQDGFAATSPQMIASGILIVALISLVLSIGRRRGPGEPSSVRAPSAPVVGVATLAIGSSFMALAQLVEIIPAWANVTGMLLLWALGAGLLLSWARKPGWSDSHRRAVAGGLLLTYAWYGFVQVPSAGDVDPVVDLLGNVILAAGAIALLGIAARRALRVTPS